MMIEGMLAVMYNSLMMRYQHMQDNARSHVSDFAKNFIERNKIPLLKCPLNCLHLNPIANL